MDCVETSEGVCFGGRDSVEVLLEQKIVGVLVKDVEFPLKSTFLTNEVPNYTSSLNLLLKGHFGYYFQLILCDYKE